MKGPGKLKFPEPRGAGGAEEIYFRREVGQKASRAEVRDGKWGAWADLGAAAGEAALPVKALISPGPTSP